MHPCTHMLVSTPMHLCFITAATLHEWQHACHGPGGAATAAAASTHRAAEEQRCGKEGGGPFGRFDGIPPCSRSRRARPAILVVCPG
jgi:hypothetical protein